MVEDPGRVLTETLARLAEIDAEAVAAALRDPAAAPSATVWRDLAAIGGAIEALRANRKHVEQIKKLAPSQDRNLKILWSAIEKAPEKRGERASGRSSRKKAGVRETVVTDFVDRLKASHPVETDRSEILGDLRSKERAVTKDEMIAIAKGALGGAYASKKAALAALERWFWHRVRATNDAKLMTRGRRTLRARERARRRRGWGL